MIVFLVLSILISITYLIVILLPVYGNFFRGSRIVKNIKATQGISFIVPFRNEEHNLPLLLQSLPMACEGVEDVEIIFVDDNSEDQSIATIQQYLPLLQKSGCEVRILSENNYCGKKQAQKAAAILAKHDVLAFTDADCVLPPRWTINMLGQLTEDVNLLCAPVVYMYKKGLLSYFFKMEFLSLVITGAGAFGIKKPVFCNGAAMMVRKNIYLNLWDAMRGSNFASGDDVFLLHAVVKNLGAESTNFVFSSEVTVQTIAPKGLKQFIMQRLRWASKAVSYLNFASLLMAITVFLMSFMIIVFALALVVTSHAVLPLFILLLSKCCADFLLFVSGFRLHKSMMMSFVSILLQPVYVVYVVTTVMLSVVMPISWKGR